MRVSRYRHSVLFDALLDNAVWNGEHLINEVGEAVIFGAALCVLGGRFGASRRHSP